MRSTSASRVLVVEDDPAIVELAQAQLESAGFSVESAQDGAEGMQKTHDGLPDVIVLDLTLPRIDGFEMLRQLQASRVFRDIPVLVLSARSSRQDVVAAISLGAKDYMVKPYVGRDLIGRVRDLLPASPNSVLI